MPVFQSTNGVEAMEIEVTVLKGKDLVAKDRNLMGKKTTSDPYVKVVFCHKPPEIPGQKKKKKDREQIVSTVAGKTKTVMKDLNPEWNETFKGSFPGTCLSGACEPHIKLEIYDYDKVGADDAMGTVTIPIPVDPPKKMNSTEWYDIPASSAKNAKGQLEIKLKSTIYKATSLIKGNSFLLESNKIRVGLAWDLVKGKAVDLDAACVALDNKGNVMMDDSVYYGNLTNMTKSITHSGDVVDGDKEGEDESIKFELDKVPKELLCLYIILTVATPKRFLNFVTSARVTIVDENHPEQGAMCEFCPTSHIGSDDATAMYLVRIARDGKKKWRVQPIEDTHPTARDFGSLIPYIKSYTKDLIPKINIDPTERVSVMRKGGSTRLQDYCPGGKVPKSLTFGLSWDVTAATREKEEEKIDLDASAICLGPDLELVDKVWFKQLESLDGAIKHMGDCRTGEAGGDDEQMVIDLKKVDENTSFIGFVINSYSGQELDDVQKASCHLFDSETGMDICTHAISDCKFLDGHTALVVCVLYRAPGKGKKKAKGGDEWCMRVISEAAMGKTVKDNVDELQNFLQENSMGAPPAQGPDEAEVVEAAGMPEEVALEGGEEGGEAKPRRKSTKKKEEKTGDGEKKKVKKTKSKD